MSTVVDMMTGVIIYIGFVVSYIAVAFYRIEKQY